ncbi:hypothetical protein BJ912DRAFT_1021758 [Pholiota molesta]|nr:hypothetical protein BJ912DRAFT_1021758 [Pholiota molesta]
MFDPLHSTASVFGGTDDANTPPWPTTPHSVGSPVPNLRRASPAPPHRTKVCSWPLWREPQIYGEPQAGLISPRETVGSNGAKYEKPEPYLRVRINGIDRNRRDILIKLDAQTNLSNFNGTTYRNVSRSYLEFQQFYEAITSAPTDEEDDRLVKIMLQRWITRVCEDPILLHDEDLRSFIESDFGYTPTPRPRKKTSSGFGIIRRGVPDEDEELQRARFELTKLEGQFFETAKAVDKLAVTRKALVSAHSEMGNKLVNVATTEAHPPLGNALRKLGRTWHSVADIDHAQAISECVILGDSLGYQGMNARSAKETLQMRTGTTISKRRQIERLKASSNIRPDRVDEALEEIEEASFIWQIATNKYLLNVPRVSPRICIALCKRIINMQRRYYTALIDARSTILYERQLLRELEALRVDVSNAAKKVVPPVNAPISPVTPQFCNPVRKATFASQSPGAGPSSPGFSQPTVPSKPAADEPPLGGRFVDGTKSMFVTKTTSVASPLTDSSSRGFHSNLLDLRDRPLGNIRPHQMSASMRVQPTRPRLDPREAASKLANMF